MSQNKFQIPDKTLGELNEFAGGGYILFIYDQEGVPKIYADFDTVGHALGMQKFIENWQSIVDTANLEASLEEINNPSQDGEDFSQDS